MTIEDIRNLIIKGKHEKALDAMLEIVKANNDDDLQNSLILQSGRFQGNERQNRLGLITSDNYSRTTNQITMALLSYLDDMKDNGYEGNTDRSRDDGGNRTSSVEAKKILFLASNPSGTGILQLEKEHSRISGEIQDSDFQQLFQIKRKLAVTLSEFQKFLVLERPHIVHFAGHGEKGHTEIKENSATRGIETEEEEETFSDSSGIILYDETKRNPKFVATNVIRRMFNSIVKRQEIPIQAVVFNSCYSEMQSEALARIVPYVVGTSSAVKDQAAIAFATGFYFGIGQGMDVVDACDMGITQAMAYGEPEDRFVLYKDGKKVEWQ